MLELIKGRFLSILKPEILKFIENTDFSQLIINNLTDENKNLIKEKLYTSFLEYLKSLDDDEVAILAIKLKNLAIKYLEDYNKDIDKVLSKVIDRFVKNLEEDESFRNAINDFIKNSAKQKIEEFIDS